MITPKHPQNTPKSPHFPPGDPARPCRLSGDGGIARVPDAPDAWAERRDWSALSEATLNRVWDNDEDAVYDDWRALYGA